MSADYMIVFPEILMAAGAMILLMYGTFAGGDERRFRISHASAALMTLVAIIVSTGSHDVERAFDGAFVNDAYARYSKVLILLSSAATLLLGRDWLERRGLLKFEYPVLLVLAALGMMMMVSAGGLISLYMGLELQSLALYVVAAFNRDSSRSTEAGLKYFVLGALSSGLLLYGASLIYGYAGTVRFDGISAAVAAGGGGVGLTFGLVFVCAALAFKISAAPFHMWTPDVYEGAPTPVTAFLATAPKVAAGALFARALFDGFGLAVEDWRQILFFVAAASMILGSIAAIGQTNIKRLMAYSSIGHMGFALTGLAAGTQEGVDAFLLYLSIYVVMNIGVFAFILGMERNGRPVAAIADINGLARTHPGRAIAVAVLMFSLAGLPPMVGFFAKFLAFKAAVDAGLTVLVVVGAVASAIGAFYYLNIVRIMYLNDPSEPLDLRFDLFRHAALAVATVLMAAGWLPFLEGLGVPAMTHAAAEALLK